jgi:hypothetical protein
MKGKPVEGEDDVDGRNFCHPILTVLDEPTKSRPIGDRKVRNMEVAVAMEKRGRWMSSFKGMYRQRT